jgi:hypothetical protein
VRTNELKEHPQSYFKQTAYGRLSQKLHEDNPDHTPIGADNIRIHKIMEILCEMHDTYPFSIAFRVC